MALLTSFSPIWLLRRLFSALAVAKRGKVPTPGWQNTVPSCSRELPFFALIFFLCLPHYFAALMHIFAAPFELFTNSYISSRPCALAHSWKQQVILDVDARITEDGAYQNSRACLLRWSCRSEEIQLDSVPSYHDRKPCSSHLRRHISEVLYDLELTSKSDMQHRTATSRSEHGGRDCSP